MAAAVADGRRPDDRDLGPAHRRPRAAHRRALQGLFPLPYRIFRQVLFLGRHAPHRLRYRRQVSDRCRNALPQPVGYQGAGGGHLLSDARTAEDPVVLVDVRRGDDALGGEAALPGDLEHAGRHLPRVPRTARGRGLRLQRHGAAGRRRAAARRRLRVRRAASLCGGGIQCADRVRETAFQIPRRHVADRFLLGLRRLLHGAPRAGGRHVRAYEPGALSAARADRPRPFPPAEGADGRFGRVECGAVQICGPGPLRTGRPRPAGQADRRGAHGREPAPAASLRPAARGRQGECHDGLSAASDAGLHLRRAARGAAEPLPRRGRRACGVLPRRR